MPKEIVLQKDEVIVSETDEKGKILYANDDFCKICGYSKDELIGKPHNIVRHPDMPKVAFKDLWQTIKAGRVWQGIVKNLAKNGDYYWVNAKVFPSKREDGGVKYVSVRVKPTKEEIDNAEELYRKLKGQE